MFKARTRPSRRMARLPPYAMSPDILPELDASFTRPKWMGNAILRTWTWQTSISYQMLWSGDGTCDVCGQWSCADRTNQDPGRKILKMNRSGLLCVTLCSPTAGPGCRSIVGAWASTDDISYPEETVPTNGGGEAESQSEANQEFCWGLRRWRSKRQS